MQYGVGFHLQTKSLNSAFVFEKQQKPFPRFPNFASFSAGP